MAKTITLSRLSFFKRAPYFVITVIIGWTIPLQANLIMQYDSFNKEKLDTLLSQHNQEGMVHSTFKLQHSHTHHIQAIFSKLFPDLILAIDTRLNTIHMFHPGNHKTFKKVLKLLDRPLQQIHIDAKILEISYDSLAQYQFLISKITQGLPIKYNFKTQSLHSINSLEDQLVYLEKKGKAMILANPNLTTIENSPAKIEVGEQIPYLTSLVKNEVELDQLKHLKTGIRLDVTPRVSSSNHINMDIEIDISSVKLWKRLRSQSYPVLSDRRLRTQIQVKSGQTAILAGLFEQRQNHNNTQHPMIKHIPILNKLFQSESNEKNKSDLIIFITPTLQSQATHSDNIISSISSELNT